MYKAILVLLSAFLLYLSSPGPGLYFCAWFALVPLLLVCRQSTAGQSLLSGFLTGFFYYIFLLRWVTISLENYGNLPWWISWSALLLLAAYMGIYPALFSWIANRSLKRFRHIWALPVVWVSLDFIRSFLFTGFPWQDLGYSQFSNPLLIQAADLTGHYGITFLIVLANTVIFSLIVKLFSLKEKDGLRISPPCSLGQAVAALILIGAALVYSSHQRDHFLSIRGQAGISTAVIQGSIKQEEKWLNSTARQTVDKYIDLSLQAAEKKEPDLIIWPETAIPFLRPDSSSIKNIAARVMKKGDYPLLTGMPYYTRDSGENTYYNSALLIRPDFSFSLYHKQHLVPFGEYIPFRELLNLPGPLVQSIGNFSAGESSEPLKAGNARAGVLICFESIFPELARKEVKSGADLLVNITNDAWFGRSSATVQHMAMAVFRAVENRRSLARAANTGISCFILPSGNIKKATPLFEPLFITADLPLLREKTFYNLYGWLFPHACLILSLIILFFCRLPESTKRNRGRS